MNLGGWLNNLTNLDLVVILSTFLAGCGLAYLTIGGLRNWYGFIQKQSKYMHKIPLTPFTLLVPAIFYTIILYRIFGVIITNWLR